MLNNLFRPGEGDWRRKGITFSPHKHHLTPFPELKSIQRKPFFPRGTKFGFFCPISFDIRGRSEEEKEEERRWEQKNPAISACQSAIAITLPLGLWRVSPTQRQATKNLPFWYFPLLGEENKCFPSPQK